MARKTKAFKSSNIQLHRRSEHAELYNALFSPSHQIESLSSTSNYSSNEVNILRDALTRVITEKNHIDASLCALQALHTNVQQQLEQLREARSTEVNQLRKELSHTRESRDHLSRIQESLIPVLESLTLCCICRDVAKIPLTTLTCGHLFCEECLDGWTDSRYFATCPTCRRIIEKVDRNLVGLEDLLTEARKL